MSCRCGGFFCWRGYRRLGAVRVVACGFGCLRGHRVFACGFGPLRALFQIFRAGTAPSCAVARHYCAVRQSFCAANDQSCADTITLVRQSLDLVRLISNPVRLHSQMVRVATNAVRDRFASLTGLPGLPVLPILPQLTFSPLHLALRSPIPPDLHTLPDPPNKLKQTPLQRSGVCPNYSNYFSPNSKDAFTNSRNSGCGRVGRDVNSGWN